ncbi:MAG: hypothetical protein COB67_10560 [SAR324 cluster bacterium]|uniref:Response regulatory domain-containing protein n=1 Tax=SAR324 cluster bacterium TaxID=2024889 RepID=A0A2A4SX06_9DELT|nr:MAG: hypothetical protein COB67_10560 [SAR324 cluster bacterium]
MRLLIVDDSMLIRKLIVREVQEGDFETIEAEDGRDALAKIELFRPDLITLDVDMPGMSGFEVCSRIRCGDPEYFKDGSKIAKTPIVFVTSNDSIEMRHSGFESGGTEFITKPFVRGEVNGVIRRILNKGVELKGLTALVVDDSKTARLMVSFPLRQKGVQILEANHGEEALKILEEDKKNQINLVLTDYNMPVMDGVELCEKIRNNLGRKELPIIFLTGLSDRDSIIRLFKVGASDYLTKPFIQEELTARVSVHLRQKQLKDEMARMLQELKKYKSEKP